MKDDTQSGSDHLVLCVHGIGNQKPGETVHDVLGGAVAEHNRVHPGSKIVADETIVTLFEEGFERYEETGAEVAKPYPGGDRTKTYPNGAERVFPPKVDTAIHNVPKGEAPKREGMQTKFPMHVKRVRKQHSDEVETVMAEVFWADLSPEPKGAFATIFDLIKVIASIGYLALDNAANVGSKRGYGFVTLFLWILIGGVVALNATLLFGVVTLLLEGSFYQLDLAQEGARAGGWPVVVAGSAVLAGLVGIAANLVNKTGVWTAFGRLTELAMAVAAIGVVVGVVWGPGAPGSLTAPETVLAVTGVLTILFGRFIGRTRWDLSLWRMFSVGAGAWGLVVLVWIAFLPDLDAIKAGCDPSNSFCKSILENGVGVDSAQLYYFVNQLMKYLTYVLAAAIVACMVTYLVWLFDKDEVGDSAPPQQRRMYATICSGLLLLWLIMASSFWVGIQSVTDGIQKQEVTADCAGLSEALIAGGAHCHETVGILTHVFTDFLAEVAPTMGVAVLFLGLLGVAGIAIVILRHRNRDVLFIMAQSKPVVGRLLLNGGIQWLFAASTFVLFIVAVQFRLDPFGMNPETPGWLAGFLRFVPPILLGVAIIVYQMRDLVAGGLGAFRDIVVYANNDALKPDLGSDAANLDNYPPRKQIESRFERVCRMMIDQVQPKRLTVICHSQGTVVSTRNLRRLLEARVFDGIEVTLVTMGSPVTHLYRKYFPRDFRVEPADFEGVRWYNIGRTDDFVGTYIENLDEINGADPQPVETSEYNLLVPAGGHPGYFTDPYVWQHFTQKIGFKLVD